MKKLVCTRMASITKTLLHVMPCTRKVSIKTEKTEPYFKHQVSVSLSSSSLRSALLAALPEPVQRQGAGGLTQGRHQPAGGDCVFALRGL